MDRATLEQRHANMAAIRSTNTAPERAVRSALFKLGFRFRKNDARLAGKPDIVLPHYHAIIFVNGCFWHGHVPFAVEKLLSLKNPSQKKKVYSAKACPKYHIPKTNSEFWVNKIKRNRERDAKEIQELMEEGWRVCLVWECSITGKKRAEKIRNVSEKISLWLEEEFDRTFAEF